MKAMKATKVSDAPIQAVVVAEIADQPSLSDKLRELQSAQDAGLMSPEDFAATKAILLASFSGGQGAVVSQPQISQPLEPKAVHPKASLTNLVLGTHPPPSELTSPETRISTTDIAGKCWMCLCFPGGWACFEKIANGENGLIHRGMVCLFFGLPLGFEERRWRVPNTNGFYKENERGNVDHYCSPSCVCNGISCSTKPC